MTTRSNEHREYVKGMFPGAVARVEKGQWVVRTWDKGTPIGYGDTEDIAWESAANRR